MTTTKPHSMCSRALGAVRLLQRGRGLFAGLFAALLVGAFNPAFAQESQMMVRLSEIELNAPYVDQYKAILTEEAEASVRLEPGVIAIVPMYERQSATTFRILEIYANRPAYEAHLKTPHFQKYKTGTLHMVKSLKLVDMQTIVDAQTMASVFAKLNKP